MAFRMATRMETPTPLSPYPLLPFPSSKPNRSSHRPRVAGWFGPGFPLARAYGAELARAVCPTTEKENEA